MLKPAAQRPLAESTNTSSRRAFLLSPCDNYRPVTIFWQCPEVVPISDKNCTPCPPRGDTAISAYQPAELPTHNLATDWMGHAVVLYLESRPLHCIRNIMYTVGRLVIRKVLMIKIWGVSSYSSGPPAKGTPQI